MAGFIFDPPERGLIVGTLINYIRDRRFYYNCQKNSTSYPQSW
jgi:hypothetical protein